MLVEPPSTNQSSIDSPKKKQNPIDIPSKKMLRKSESWRNRPKEAQKKGMLHPLRITIDSFKSFVYYETTVFIVRLAGKQTREFFIIYHLALVRMYFKWI